MEEFIKYETALIAKEKGFNIYQSTFYNRTGDFHKSAVSGYDFTSCKHNVVAPTQAVLQKWLREKENIIIYVEHKIHGKFKREDVFFYRIILPSGIAHNVTQDFKTWEEALEEGLVTALKLID